MRNRAWRRKADWHHALRKRRMSPEWYTVLHRYSKGKIHCSCPICATKSKKRRKVAYGSRINWRLADMRRMTEMADQEKELKRE